MGDELPEEMPVALEECQDMPTKRHAHVANGDSIDDMRVAR